MICKVSNSSRLRIEIGFITGLLIINLFTRFNSTEIVIPTFDKSLWSGTDQETDIFFGGIIEIFPVCVYQPDPVYPEKAFINNIEGSVGVWVCLDETGSVKKVTVLPSSGYPSLDEVAVQAAYESRWLPAQDNGEGVSIWTSLSYSFTIPD